MSDTGHDARPTPIRPRDIYREAQFLLGISRLAQAPDDSGYEVAFGGRSNAGKSSAINTLTGRNALARVSRTPGRTQRINFFTLTDTQRLVDLPGYGYARVPEAVKRAWGRLVEDYLRGRTALRGLVVVMDARRPLMDADRQLVEWSLAAQVPLHLLLTKADKLKRGAATRALAGVRAEVEGLTGDITAALFSALNRSGVDDLRHRLDVWFGQKEAPASCSGGEGESRGK